MVESSSTAKPKPARKQIDFIVTTSDPSNASSAKANKKRVRSVAALKSWPERRKKMFEDLEAKGTGHGAFLVDRDVQEETQHDSRGATTTTSAAPPRYWPERRTKAFQPAKETSSGAASSTARSEQLINRPGEQSQWSQSLPTPSYAHSSLSGPKVPPGFTDASPRYVLYGSLPDRTTPPAEYRTIDLNSKNNYTTAESLVPLDKVTAAQLFPVYPSQQESYTYHPTVSWSSNIHYPAESSSKKKRTADGVDKDTAHGNGSMLLLTPPTSPHTDAARGRADPFNCYTVEWQPWFDRILHHMMTIYAPRGWPALRITQTEGIAWEWFLTQNALSEPALFYVRLLFGSGDLIRLGGLPPYFMLWLRSKAISFINAALSDPVRSCSDALILAVGRIAMHEHMYGDREMSVAIHRPAQKRMIVMRGGMKELGHFPAVVRRLMRWSDGVMAIGTGTERMLEEVEEEKNPGGFSVGESVRAIEKWAPQEMPRVRTSIKVAELLNHEAEEGQGGGR